MQKQQKQIKKLCKFKKEEQKLLLEIWHLKQQR